MRSSHSQAEAPNRWTSSTSRQRDETEDGQVASVWGDGARPRPEVTVTHDNFFDLGGHSLKLLALHVRLVDELDARLSVTDLFQHTTVEAQAAAIAAAREGGLVDEASAPSDRRMLRATADALEQQRVPREDVLQRDNAIAIVAMTGRFPGADDVDTFWDNLCAGVESTRFFTDEELRASGVPEEHLAHPAYVRARAVLEHPDLFDARFFGSPRTTAPSPWRLAGRRSCSRPRAYGSGAALA